MTHDTKTLHGVKLGTGGYLYNESIFGPRWISDFGPEKGLNLKGLHDFAVAARKYGCGITANLREWELSALLSMIADSNDKKFPCPDPETPVVQDTAREKELDDALESTTRLMQQAQDAAVKATEDYARERDVRIAAEAREATLREALERIEGRPGPSMGHILGLGEYPISEAAHMAEIARFALAAAPDNGEKV